MVAIVHHTYDEPKEWNIGGYPYAHMFEHFNAVQIVEADGFELEQIIITSTKSTIYCWC